MRNFGVLEHRKQVFQEFAGFSPVNAMSLETSSLFFPQRRLVWTNDETPRADAACVLYWMTAFRRLGWNFALERAVAWAETLGKPLVIVETWSTLFPWSSLRQLHFLLGGMKEKAEQLRRGPGTYHPFVETGKGQVVELFRRLSPFVACVVTDFYPLRPWRKQLMEVARTVERRIEAVDSNGLVPLLASSQIFARAFDFRRFWQRNFWDFYGEQPLASPLAKLKASQSLPAALRKVLDEHRLNIEELSPGHPRWKSVRFDCDVRPVDIPGGTGAARERLDRFVLSQLPTYADHRNHPDLRATSGLSPYLHWGFLSPQEIFAALVQAEGWTPERCRRKADGSVGFLGMGRGAEVFLDQLLTWREIGFNFTMLVDNYDRFESLPRWAQETLRQHNSDQRPYVYSRAELEAAKTHDPLWNAAQNELCTTGLVHNYMRMLWGKKILEWTKTAEEALEIMIDLNNKYALDAEDPNSYSGIFWILGRYDRPWGPERPIFGKIRYMSTDAAARKLRLKNYLGLYASRQKSLWTP